MTEKGKESNQIAELPLEKQDKNLETPTGMEGIDKEEEKLKDNP